MDVIGRDDFYGIVAENGLRVFAPALRLTAASHVLDLGSGIGGPARFLARTYGCKVTGIDLSAFNHRTALARTKAASLDQLVGFVLGDALQFPFPDATFTHVFGCESWCYFPDKTQAYRAAFRVLRPGGLVAFLEAACESPVRLQTEELLGPVRYERLSRYEDMLAAAGFTDIRWQDTTTLASRDISAALYRLITRRRPVVAAAGEDVYFALLELWAEFLAYFAEGKMTHCGFIAEKPRSPDQP
jgi:SAM-dependent methyltransferase